MAKKLVCLIATVVCVCWQPMAKSVPPLSAARGVVDITADQLAGCWDFETSDDQWVADISGCGHLMSAANCMDLSSRIVSASRAARLGGDNEYLGVIIKPDTSLANLDERFTVTLRIAPDRTTRRCVILAYNFNGLCWTVGRNELGELVAGLRGDGVSRGLRAPMPSDGGHVAITFSRQHGPTDVYIQGVAAETVAEPDFWGPGDTCGLLVGCRRNHGKTPSQLYSGLLDDLIVINSEIDAEDAKQLASRSCRELFELPNASIPAEPFLWNMTYSREQLGHRLRTDLRFSGFDINLQSPPAGLRIDESVGLLVNQHAKVQKIHAWPRPRQKVDVPRGLVTPGGDWLVMFAAGRNQYGCSAELRHVKTNEMLSYRSADQGRTWQGPTRAWTCDHSSSFTVPFIPAGSNRIYVFGTEPIPSLRENKEDGPIVYRYSDDDGHTWSAATRIRPVNLPDYTGISGMRMCQTRAGTWLLGTHKKQSFDFTSANGFTLREKQFVLRSTDEGQTWNMHLTSPAAPPQEPPRRNEGRVIDLSDGRAMMLARVQGHLWQSFSADDGVTWSLPEPQKLVHPAAPPMIFHLSDGKTLIQLIHNRYGGKEHHQADRNELWVSLSMDDGTSWSEPGLLMANLVENVRRPNLSYTDMFTDEGQVHFVVPHLWEQVLHVSLPEQELFNLPKAGDLPKAAAD
ncbi:sialidase family protein [Aeoliella sp.]|uniref:sialidase family protein n=1 Tax=Aeoliella sp. TaxID=2795800 RepID=UPI003CCB9C5A